MNIKDKEKQKGYVKEVKKHGIKKEAARRAGYSEKTNTSIIEKADYVKKELENWNNLLAKELPDDLLIKPIKEATEAMRGKNKDHQTRLKASELGFKVKGRMRPDMVVNIPMKIEIGVVDETD